MRLLLILVAIGLLLVESHCQLNSASVDNKVLPATKAETVTSTRVDFDTQIKPILKAKCTPCHFKDGAVYDRLPFDKPETIRKLGTKLFTRIKDEEQRQLIRDFLNQSP